MISFLNVGNGDAILIQTINENKHILIDGGVERNKIINSRLTNEISAILKGNNSLDLVVVTHSDDDHIGGILNIVGDENIEKRIKKYVFHAEKYISQLTEGEYQNRENYSVVRKYRGSTKSSYGQDKRLTEMLEDNGEKWDRRIYLAGDEILIGKAKLTVLSPTIEKVKKLQEFWEKEKKKIKKVSQKSSSKDKSYDYSTLFKDFKFENLGKDDSETNGASIALIYEEPIIDQPQDSKEKIMRNFKALLLADSHPEVIRQSLKSLLKNNESKHKFDFVKLAHHGSKNNITKELLELIDCSKFVISANANESHRHPNKETLALIINHYGVENVNFYFTNDNSKIREIFKKEDFRNFHFPGRKDNKIILTYGD
ncbi:MBL fold metallo-hydrolase [Marinifilum fragile]|uniref:ComEC/Rec2 family competence protein n=1 Tax=Marinifilum fragile TaxID=570161 RepID=UPI002AAAC0BA|nr:MBL fold metallo-hydrolase [Marinifilum fragile]